MEKTQHFVLYGNNPLYPLGRRSLWPVIGAALFISLNLSPPAQAACTLQEADAATGTPKTLTCDTSDPNPVTDGQTTDATLIILQEGAAIATTGDDEHGILSTGANARITLNNGASITTAGKDAEGIYSDGASAHITLNGVSRIVAEGADTTGIFYSGAGSSLSVGPAAWVHSMQSAAVGGNNVSQKTDISGTLSTGKAASSVVANLAGGNDLLIYRPSVRMLTEVGVKKDADGSIIRDAKGLVVFTNNNKQADVTDDFTNNDNGVVDGGYDVDTLRLVGDDTRGVAAQAAQFTNFEVLQSAGGENTWQGSLTDYVVGVLDGQLSLGAGETEALDVNISGTGKLLVTGEAKIKGSEGTSAPLIDFEATAEGAELILASDVALLIEEAIYGISSSGAGAKVTLQGDAQNQQGASISTRVVGADGIVSSGGHAIITLESYASIAIQGAINILSRGADAKITLNDQASITTEGSSADGIFSQGNNAQITLNGASIITKGGVASGIYSDGANAHITLNNGARIMTAGVNAYGIRNRGNNAHITLNDGARITTAGTGADGIYSTGENAHITLNDGARITTAGTGADGIYSTGENAHITLNDRARITAAGEGVESVCNTSAKRDADGMYDSTLDGVVVTTIGDIADGIYSDGDDAQIILDGARIEAENRVQGSFIATVPARTSP